VWQLRRRDYDWRILGSFGAQVDGVFTGVDRDLHHAPGPQGPGLPAAAGPIPVRSGAGLDVPGRSPEGPRRTTGTWMIV